MSEKVLLLNHQQIEPIIKRMALQIVENNLDVKELIIAGIKDRGVDIADMLVKVIRKVSSIHIQQIDVTINKKNPLEVLISGDLNLTDKTIIIVDDVADSGKTMIYAIKPFLRFMVQKIEVAVLIDREHKRFPIISNYIGYQISTTIKENIQVEVKKGLVEAYIS